MADPTRVLFVSTGGAARAVLAEALLRHVGGGAFEAVSAGTDPVGVDPLALQVLGRAGIDTAGLASRSLAEVEGQFFDWVITVCDDARSVCPVFPGADMSLHWGYPSPARAVGTDDERRVAYERVFVQLGERIRQFVLVVGRTAPAPVG
jgi:protein-tyrosine-phosphatase